VLWLPLLRVVLQHCDSDHVLEKGLDSTAHCDAVAQLKPEQWRQQVRDAAKEGDDEQLVALGFADGKLRSSVAGRPCGFSKLHQCIVPHADSANHCSIQCAERDCPAIVHVVCALDTVSQLAVSGERERVTCPKHAVSEPVSEQSRVLIVAAHEQLQSAVHRSRR